ncbi:unnamed protein product [Strongylus vulgaris]|uniref:SH2 domain-containing protein n=1 Tax=Strongylus vulgaris TaxID=40348 RepID=A0A3P7M446_STRVU|nr:unnamed protein product [Strongylus vulgaris]
MDCYLGKILRHNGDFLVRTTEPVAGQPRAFVLSVMFKEEFEDQGVSNGFNNAQSCVVCQKAENTTRTGTFGRCSKKAPKSFDETR